MSVINKKPFIKKILEETSDTNMPNDTHFSAIGNDILGVR